MKRQSRAASALPAAAGTLLLLTQPLPASAHRLDEYLQATTIALAKDHVDALLCLTPGVAVFPQVIESIDTNHDGQVSLAEQRAYMARVLGDLTLTLDGKRLTLQRTSYRFASVDEMKNGVGEIGIVFKANVPRDAKDGKSGMDGAGSAGRRCPRRLTFENRHQSRISVYLVNCLVPTDPNLQVTAQNRNYTQSLYQLDYVQASNKDSGNSPSSSVEAASAVGEANLWTSARKWGWLSVGSVAAMALLAPMLTPWRRRQAKTTKEEA